MDGSAWVAYLEQGDRWSYPWYTADATPISEMPPGKAEGALQWLIANAKNPALAIARQAMQHRAPDSTSEWWPRTASERGQVRRQPEAWIITTPLARALAARASFDDGSYDDRYIASDTGRFQPITVGALRRFLHKQPDDAVVVIARDSAGNCYSTLRELTLNATYVPDPKPYGGDNRVCDKPHAHGQSCVVLYPEW
ncbi:hypothetical protein [Nonomuraea jabiensis]|uniref:hypothetical protein n=1 Tax=Nonomuraea jabiensis TaxID=882448 RepID=UPI003D72593D